ncbi:MAG: phosphate signaling complex protein PhoU [Spirochaetia bacterium]|nr:phosphate signaling complex protein PhoU [Spirochaetia bacterium]
MTDKKHQLDEKLEFFRELLLQMVNRVEESLVKATAAVRDNDQQLAERVLADDYFIDQMRTMVENDAVRLLISEAPYGHYMRQVIAGLKIVTSLERMGDHAGHFAKIASTQDRTNKYECEIVKDIVDMAMADVAMFRGAVEALMVINADMAMDVARQDDKVDAYRTSIKKKILDADPGDDKRFSRNLFEYYYIVTELERLGDHVTTICAWIVYMDQGVKPKLN